MGGNGSHSKLLPLGKIERDYRKEANIRVKVVLKNEMKWKIILLLLAAFVAVTAADVDSDGEMVERDEKEERPDVDRSDDIMVDDDDDLSDQDLNVEKSDPRSWWPRRRRRRYIARRRAPAPGRRRRRYVATPRPSRRRSSWRRRSSFRRSYRRRRSYGRRRYGRRRYGRRRYGR